MIPAPDKKKPRAAARALLVIGMTGTISIALSTPQARTHVHSVLGSASLAQPFSSVRPAQGAPDADAHRSRSPKSRDQSAEEATPEDSTNPEMGPRALVQRNPSNFPSTRVVPQPDLSAETLAEESFTLRFHLGQARVLKTHYLDSGLRPYLVQSTGEPADSKAVAEFRIRAWRATSGNCPDPAARERPRPCAEVDQFIPLSRMLRTPEAPPELLGLRPQWDPDGQTWRCPDLVLSETARTPTTMLVAAFPHFQGTRVKGVPVKTWLPLEELEPAATGDSVFQWKTTAASQERPWEFTLAASGGNEAICVASREEAVFPGGLGRPCQQDQSCLSGCCRAGTCQEHDPAQGRFCGKSWDEPCLDHEYCPYNPGYPIFSLQPHPRTGLCRVIESSKGAFGMCVDGKCRRPTEWLVVPVYRKVPKTEDCSQARLPDSLSLSVVPGSTPSNMPFEP